MRNLIALLAATTLAGCVNMAPPHERPALATAPDAPVATGKPGAPAAQESGGVMGSLNEILFGSTGPRGGKRDGLAQTMAKSAVRTMGTTVGREILRGVLGGIFGSKTRR